MKIPVVSTVFGWIMGEDMDYGIFLACFGLVIAILSLHWMGITEAKVFSWLFITAPLWLPFLTFSIFFWKYMDMVGKWFYLDAGRRTYEVIMPPEVYKSPAAMETILTQLLNKASPDNLMETYLQGKRPQVFSFEIVSRKGEIKFYVNVPYKKGARMLEPAFYSQYPGIELKLMDLDYTAELPHDLKGIFSLSFHHSKKDPQAYPIKTYIDLGLHDNPKEEEKVDPLVHMLDFMATVRPHEQMWVQILCTAHRAKSFKNGQLTVGEKDDWDHEPEEAVDKIMRRDSDTKAGPPDLDGMPRISPGERELVEAIERNAEKPVFQTAVRWIYITEPGKSSGDFFAGMLRAFEAFTISGRNGIKPKWRADFNYKFISDPFGKRLDAVRKQELKEYKLRKLFPKVPSMGTKIMTTEEIATLWHPVGTVAYTPTLNRVESTKQTAPDNLPISGNRPTFDD